MSLLKEIAKFFDIGKADSALIRRPVRDSAQALLV